MLMIQAFKGSYCPVFVCDICQQRIVNDGTAAAVSALSSTTATSPVLHAHKGQCHDEAEKRLGGALNCGWDELGHHLAKLAISIGLSPERVGGLYDEVDMLCSIR